jgi:hypothetical protein
VDKCSYFQSAKALSFEEQTMYDSVDCGTYLRENKTNPADS